VHFVAEGRSSANIAAQLGLATSTIDTYRSRMMQKLNVSSSADLVKYAILNGLVTA
jgi:DNA-binding NarL/FixJ family response regulator